MSAVPHEAVLPREAEADLGLVAPARVFFWLVAGTTLAAAVPLFPRLAEAHGWWSFFLLGGAAAVAQLFSTRTPRDQSYHSATLFLIVGALLLPPELVLLLPVLQHVPEWLKARYRWYVQTFNICNYALATLAAWGAARVVTGHVFAGHAQLRLALAGTAASVVLVALNHSLLALMLRLARGHSLRETGLFDAENVTTELVVAALGVAVFAFWRESPLLVPFAVAPLILIHRSLSVPQLQAEARVDAKTGLFNARYFGSAFADELGRAQRFERPLSLIMADLDLLRTINNTHGHLAGDAVLQGIAEVFRAQLRHYDVPARFGGEEFSILLPETTLDQALEIAERIRRAVAAQAFDVATSDDSIRATVSIGVAAYPAHGVDTSELIHQADLAVYRAKLLGRNRVVAASADPVASSEGRRGAAAAEPAGSVAPLAPALEARPRAERREPVEQVSFAGRLLREPQRPLAALLGAVGVAAALPAVLLGSASDVGGLVALLLLVGAGRALALEVEAGPVSLGVAGALAGAAVLGARAAPAVAVVIAAVEWSAERAPPARVVLNVGALTLAGLAAVAVFDLARAAGVAGLATLLVGPVAGAAYLVVDVRRRPPAFLDRLRALLPHYLAYGLLGGALALAYEAWGLPALAAAAVPLVIARRMERAYLERRQRRDLRPPRAAAEAARTQSASLEEANRLLRERSIAAMESLSAIVDARDPHAAGHSRRVRRLALAVGRELGLSRRELDVLGHAALFHDVGKVAIPDAILLKPGRLSDREWTIVREHPEEGARIIARLGFLDEALPAIRHHHERFDGSGYPDAVRGEEIPLGARIIHVAEAADSMLTTKAYGAAKGSAAALAELRRGSGAQFCPRCVAALERALPVGALHADGGHELPPPLRAAS